VGRMIKAVIFDMDGVIVDSEYYHYIVEKRILKKIGIDLSFEEAKKHAGMKTETFFRKILENHKKKADINELVKEKQKLVIDILKKRAKPIPGSIKLINLLKKNKIKLGIASSGKRERVEIILSKFKIRNKFDVVVTAEDVEHGKPDPEIFLLASKKIGIKPEECIVIEDSTNGVKAAKKAGMKCIGFVSKNSGKQDLSEADIVVDDMRKIDLDIIRRFS